MNRVKKTSLFALVLLSIATVFSGLMERENPDLKNNWSTEVEQILSTFDANYVYPETAGDMRSIIQKKLATGEYHNVDSLVALLLELQADLREISHDGHLSLHQK